MFSSVLSESAQATLAVLGKSGLFGDAYLAGGSALALYLGHRYSIDFDFFTPNAFDPKMLSAAISRVGPFIEDVAKGISLIGTFQEVKMSCFRYEYPLIEPTTRLFEIDIAHPHDIAAMKLVAIGDRGTRKDYVDLYALVQHGISIDDMFEYYDAKYKLFDANRYTLIKSLVYFDEADTTDMPVMIHAVSWDEIKKFFTTESMRLAKKYLEETP